MKFYTLAVVTLCAVFALAARPASTEERLGESGPQLAHMVYFTLAEDNAENQKKLVDACLKYLGDHPGTVYFSVGTLAEDFKRDLNDLKFDVALNLVFKDKAAHDTYQTSDRHTEFVEKNKELWSTVRVFDSYLAEKE
jgi:hypothetical protein